MSMQRVVVIQAREERREITEAVKDRGLPPAKKEIAGPGFLGEKNKTSCSRATARPQQMQIRKIRRREGQGSGKRGLRVSLSRRISPGHHGCALSRHLGGCLSHTCANASSCV